MDRRPTLVSAFTPPKGWIGVAALMTALNAEAPVLRRILTAFTDETEAQRATRGVATALLAVDRRADRSALRTVPGLIVAEPRLEAWPSGSMLHAKVALLGYAGDAEAPVGRLRLIVSTGNWTGESLNGQIDMLWMADVELADAGDRQLNADVKAAALLFRDLLYPVGGEGRLFQALPPAPRVAELLRRATDLPSGKAVRFVHSLHTPLLRQLAKRFEPAGAAWNWLYAGSGFFEQPAKGDPQVLERIGTALGRHLTASADHRILLNPTRAGALAGADLRGWTVCKPRPCDGRGSLHAKFIAVGRHHCDRHLDVTVYLGSGNLSKAGLLSAFHQGKGQTRIEAGIVFKAGSHDAAELRTLLPEGEEMDPGELAALKAGDPDPEEPPIPPPPILFARAVVASAGGPTARLCLEKRQPEGAAELRLGEDIVAIPVSLATVAAPGFAGAYLEVRAPGDGVWTAVPVLGPAGEFARVRPVPGGFEEALDALLAFPAIPEAPADGEDDGEDGVVSVSGRPEAALAGSVGRYPARDAMRVVEAIARLLPAETGAAEQEAASARRGALMRAVRRTLVDGLHKADKMELTALGVNFLVPLKEMPGMPSDREWHRLVDEVAADWGLLEIPALSLDRSGAGRGGNHD